MNPGRVVILGAGAAGLSAAWALTQAGAKVDIIESDDGVGGLCKSVRTDGFTFDLGGHRIISEDLGLLNKLRELLGDELTARERKSQILLRGKYYAYPLDAKDLLGKLEFWVSVRCVLGYLGRQVRNLAVSATDASLESWIVNRFGWPLYEIYFEPYSRKLWGLAPSAISSDWAVQRISRMSLWDVLSRLVRLKKQIPKTYVTRFLYPHHGIGQVWERVSEQVTQAGGRIHLRSRVIEVQRSGDTVTSVTLGKNGARTEMACDWLISTIPLPELVQMLRPAPEPRYSEVAASLRFRAIRFLNILINRPRVSENTWIYVPETDILFFRVQEPKNWSPYNAPEGKTSLILEIACDEGDPIWNATDKEIYTRCCADLKRMGFDIAQDTIRYFSTKVAHGYPVYDLDYKAKLSALYGFTGRIRNLLCCGRQGLFRYNNMDHSMKMGFLAAEHILGGAPRESIFKVGAEASLFEYDNVLQETRPEAAKANLPAP